MSDIKATLATSEYFFNLKKTRNNFSPLYKTFCLKVLENPKIGICLGTLGYILYTFFSRSIFEVNFKQVWKYAK